jgi:hypothetical protein
MSGQLRRALRLLLGYLACLLGLRLVNRVEDQIEARLEATA